jgi:hypothetical protein
MTEPTEGYVQWIIAAVNEIHALLRIKEYMAIVDIAAIIKKHHDMSSQPELPEQPNIVEAMNEARDPDEQYGH